MTHTEASEIRLRNATHDDFPEITRIYNGYVTGSTASFEMEPLSRETMAERLRTIADKYPVIVAETSDGQIAGYCYAHAWKAYAAYSPTVESTVYLHPDFTGLGIGTLLMDRLIDECRKCGFRAIVADITIGNEASEALHRKLGFKQVSRFEGIAEKFGKSLGVVDYLLLL